MGVPRQLRLQHADCGAGLRSHSSPAEADATDCVGEVRFAAGKVENTIADARFALRRAEAELRAGVDGVRSQVEPKVACISNEVEARLAPIVAKLGLKPKAKRAPRKARKTAAKKPAARRAVRKPAKRVAKKAAR